MRACAGLFLLVFSFVASAVTEVEGVRIWPAPDHTRVVLDMSAQATHRLFVLSNPERVVVDIHDSRLSGYLPRVAADDTFVSGVRTARHENGALRVVLDVKRAVRPRSFLLRPSLEYGHRLVIDLFEPRRQPESIGSAPSAPGPSPARERRDVVIALDPGHGGEDPGAIGRSGTREKSVVFAIAQRLKQLIDNEPGMRAVLTRSGDYYVRLRERMEIARGHGADLFVSIHADAFRDHRVRGSSVYILSRRGASSEAARWLATQENSADLAGGVSLDDKDELLASVLLDLSQTATLSASTDAAGRILHQLKRVGRTHKRHVERAGFMVLKSPDIPSILVETAFLSNPNDERSLNEPRYQYALSKALLRGIREFFVDNPPPDTRFAMRRHTITRGDTLSEIATRYGVPLNELKRSNQLQTDTVRIGQVLTIPASDS
ncbi:MAG: N-acetylmuramoyl-L-alanine amidase [Gammaproteobacteria bacterium]|nr:N-acetylmuramoyl-L-alanine amidase [Gammaproteobacteria bacterium]